MTPTPLSPDGPPRSHTVDLARPTEAQVERGAQALCKFVFPGALVPRLDMSAAVLAAVADPGADLPERRIVDVHGGAQATLDYVLACIEGDRFKDSIGTTAEWYVAYSLGQSAHLYHCESFAQVAAERSRYREALQTIAAAASGEHTEFGAACGEDACAVCLIEEMAKGALAHG